MFHLILCWSHSHTEKSSFVNVSASPSINHTRHTHTYLHPTVLQCFTVSSHPDSSPSISSMFYLRPSSPSPSGTHCGYLLPPVVVSASDTISVTFQSDSRLTDRGFSARWDAVYPEDIAGITKTHTDTGTHSSHLRHMLLKQLNTSLRQTIKHLSPLCHMYKNSKVVA